MQYCDILHTLSHTMKIVYLSESTPLKKITKSNDLKAAALLLASHDYHSARSKREAEKVLNSVLKEKAIA